MARLQTHSDGASEASLVSEAYPDVQAGADWGDRGGVNGGLEEMAGLGGILGAGGWTLSGVEDESR